MKITISSPTPSSMLFVGETFVISGTATYGVTKVHLSADGAPSLSPADIPVTGGAWTFSRAFSRPGFRTITAQGKNSAGVDVGEPVSVTVLLDTTHDTCDLAQPLFKIGTAPKAATIYRLPGHKTYFYRAALTIDADGALHAYNPQNTGLDFNENGKYPSGKWFAVVCSDPPANLKPVVQGPNDPAPGYYISTTSLENTALAKTNPHRYVDSETIPYFVLPGSDSVKNLGAKLGDFGVVYNAKNGTLCYAIYADSGPKGKIGEGSIALAKALKIPSSPKVGGLEERKLLFVVFPGSRAAYGTPWTHTETADDIAAAAMPFFLEWGGIDRLKNCYTHLL